MGVSTIILLCLAGVLLLGVLPTLLLSGIIFKVLLVRDKHEK